MGTYDVNKGSIVKMNTVSTSAAKAVFSFMPIVGHRHATISLICMSTHKATAARCLSYHQAAYGQPAIRALATAPLRRLALSVLFTIVTNSYQTTCTVSERTFNKRHTPMQDKELTSQPLRITTPILNPVSLLFNVHLLKCTQFKIVR